MNHIYKSGIASAQAVSAASIDAVNDAAWDNFTAASWGGFARELDSFFGFFRGAHAAFEAYFGVHKFTVPSLNTTMADYVQTRDYLVLPLITEVGGTQFSLAEMYAVSEMSLRVSGALSGGSHYPFFTLHQNAYQQVWGAYDVSWGFVDNADLVNLSGQPPSLPLSALELHAVKPSLAAAGLLDIADTALASGVSVPNADVPIDESRSSELTVDLTSLIDEKGGDYLLIVFTVPSASIVQQTPDSNFLLGSQHSTFRREDMRGPRAVWITSAAVGDYNLVEIWGCILSLTVRIDIEQASSTVVEEDRLDSANYLSGSGQSKTFRLQDNSASGGAMLTERLFLAGEDNFLWSQSDPFMLDQATEFPAVASAGTTVDFDANDDNEAQIWDLTPVAGAHAVGTITATLFLFGTNQDTDASLEASLKVGGVFGADQTINLDLGEPGWKSVELASGLSVADLAGAQLRLTTGTTTGTETFHAIYVLLESTGSVNVTRRCDVSLSESGGNTFLNFDYHRESDPADADYYIEPDPPFQVQVGAGTAYETIGDLTGAEHTFNHSGADNADTGKGTVDATVKITVEHISVSNALP